jgi:hypothetical protein
MPRSVLVFLAGFICLLQARPAWLSLTLLACGAAACVMTFAARLFELLSARHPPR